ncbi:hypothetical protein [Uliginosibacterium sediminicola]|uniref:Uncharacterized protein n=1 Tax=Uliginosibacterium sediminicola TaxID=2024550 RepID=A0ABU9YYJ2_9RHOO
MSVASAVRPARLAMPALLLALLGGMLGAAAEPAEPTSAADTELAAQSGPLAQSPPGVADQASMPESASAAAAAPETSVASAEVSAASAESVSAPLAAAAASASAASSQPPRSEVPREELEDRPAPIAGQAAVRKQLLALQSSASSSAAASAASSKAAVVPLDKRNASSSSLSLSVQAPPPPASPALPANAPAWLRGCKSVQMQGAAIMCDADGLLTLPSERVQVYTREEARILKGSNMQLRESLPMRYRFFLLP